MDLGSPQYTRLRPNSHRRKSSSHCGLQAHSRKCNSRRASHHRLRASSHCGLQANNRKCSSHRDRQANSHKSSNPRASSYSPKSNSCSKKL